MTYQVQQPSVGASVGAGIGKSLAELVPKEVERYRLSKGLQQLGQQKNLTPLQYYTQALSIPGLADRPELLRTFGQLLQSEAQRGIEPSKNLGSLIEKTEPQVEGRPTLTSERAQKEAINPYVPPTRQEQRARVNEIVSQTGVSREVAEEEVAREIESNKAVSSQLQHAYQNQQAIEKQLKSQFDTVNKEWNNSIPNDQYQKYYSQALSDLQKGESPEQITKKFGEEINEVGRQYSDLNTLSRISPTDAGKRLPSLQKKFAARGDERNFAQKLATTLGLSTPFSYSLAYPISQNPKLSKDLKSIPQNPGYSPAVLPYTKPVEIQEKYPILLKDIEKGNGSPLAIAYELAQKGYDPADFMNYLSQNKENLTAKQIDELTKEVHTSNPFTYLSDKLIKWYLR